VPSLEQVLAMLVERDRVIDELRAELAAVRAENDELKRRSGQNSKNSSRPPSGDRLDCSLSRAQQRKLGRNPGKQPGAEGFTLRRTDDATRTRNHVADECGGCGAGLADAETVRVTARQVCDLPESTTVEVVEHRIHAKRCGCGHVTGGPVPAGVTAPVQYGPRLRALAAYLVVYQHVPVARAAELIAEVCGAVVSTGWVSSVVAATGEALEPVQDAIRARLVQACLLHVDETSINVNGEKWWIHVASTETLTQYFLHKRLVGEAFTALQDNITDNRDLFNVATLVRYSDTIAKHQGYEGYSAPCLKNSSATTVAMVSSKVA
jgi:transposase